MSIANTRKESLRLYRDILKTCRLYGDTRNTDGVLVRIQVASSARHEFEQGRFETDPEIIAKMIVTGRDCLMQVQEKIVQKREDILGGKINPD